MGRGMRQRGQQLSEGSRIQWQGELPNTEWIDSISPHNPVLLYLGHVGVVAHSHWALLAGMEEEAPS